MSLAASEVGLAAASPATCPASFGELPRAGATRIVRLKEADEQGRRSFQFAIVSAQPLTRPFLGPLRAELGGLLPAGSNELHADGDRVWFLELDVSTARASDGRTAARVELELRPSHGASHVRTSMVAWTEEELDLASIEGAVPAADVTLPARVLLATVDGNPIELALQDGDPAMPEAAQGEVDDDRHPWIAQSRDLARRRERGPVDLFQ